MKQMRLMDDNELTVSIAGLPVPTTNGAVMFILDFQRMLDLATERGDPLWAIRNLSEGVQIAWSTHNTLFYPTLHAAIRAEIARLSR